MNKILIMLLMVFLVPVLASARDGQTLTLRGYIVDNQCAAGQTDAQLEEFVKTHTKECALADACVASGYAIFANHHLYKFDQGSTAAIVEYLKQPSSTLFITVKVKKGEDEVRLVTIVDKE